MSKSYKRNTPCKSMLKIPSQLKVKFANFYSSNQNKRGAFYCNDQRYWCSVCGESISKKVYSYSIDHFGKALCYTHQRTPFSPGGQETITPHALRLSKALNDLRVNHELEYYDGHKHVDIAIPSAKLFLELDGMQHAFNPKQMIADDERDKYSQKSGWSTKRIPNVWIDKDVDKLASSIAILVRKRENESKEYSFTGLAKIMFKKLSETLDGFE